MPPAYPSPTSKAATHTHSGYLLHHEGCLPSHTFCPHCFPFLPVPFIDLPPHFTLHGSAFPLWRSLSLGCGSACLTLAWQADGVGGGMGRQDEPERFGHAGSRCWVGAVRLPLASLPLLRTWITLAGKRQRRRKGMTLPATAHHTQQRICATARRVSTCYGLENRTRFSRGLGWWRLRLRTTMAAGGG